MGVKIIALIADWRPTVEAYRESGTDFYWEKEGELPFADEDSLLGFKMFLDTACFYGKIREHLPAPDRARFEPFLRLIASLYDDEDDEAVNDLLTDAGGPLPEDPMLFAMRPATVHRALELAWEIPWRALEDATDRVDLSDVSNDVWSIRHFDNLYQILSTYIEWLREAARADRGLVVLVDM